MTSQEKMKAVSYGSQVEFRADVTIQKLFYDQAQRTPDHVALSFEREELAYADLNKRSNQIAHFLTAHGVGRNHLVGILMHKGLDVIVAALGILKAGGAYVPLDPQYPRERLLYLLEDTRVDMVLTHSHQLESENLKNALDDLKAVVCVDEVSGVRKWNNPGRLFDMRHLREYSEENHTIINDSADRAYVIYTSGTTGKPKGVVNSHRSVCNMISWATHTFEAGPADQYLQLASISFDVSVAEIFPPLCSGGRLNVTPSPQTLSPLELLQMLRDLRITILTLPPSLAYQLDSLLEEKHKIELSSLRLLIMGGEKLLLAQIERWRTLLGPHLRLVNVYGPTETTVLSTAYWLDPVTDKNKDVGPLGKPIFNEQIYIVNENLELCEVDETGEILIGGNGLTDGYLNDPEKTRNAFIPNPFSDVPGERVYRSGDLGRIRADGIIEFMGRRDDQVKVRGFRIELGEVEAALSRHPKINQVAVVAHQHQEGHYRLSAYFTSSESLLAPDSLRAFLKEKLPEHMIPAGFHQLERMPLTPHGKIDRKNLPLLDSCSRPDLDHDYVMPLTESEKIVARIWSELLKVDKVGLHDNFFGLGGDSIIGIQVMGRLNRLGYRTKPLHSFKYQTVYELASFIDRQTLESKKTPSPDKPISGGVLLTPMQMWFFEKAFASPNHWHQSVEFEIHEQVSAEFVGMTMNMLIAHHDMLRCQFLTSRIGVQQAILSKTPEFKIHTHDLSDLASTWRQEELKKICHELRSSVHLDTAPLMKVGLIRLDESLYHFIWIIHHTVVDTVSWKILLDDFNRIYRTLSQGRQITRPSKTTSYPEWSQRLNEHASSPEGSQQMKAEFEYWKPRLADESYRLRLPFDFSAEVVRMSEVEIITRALSERETEYLLGRAHQCFNTKVQDLLLAALYRSLAKWSGGEKIVVQLEGHGRDADHDEDLDLSETVGWFTSLYPFFAEIRDEESIGDSIINIKESRSLIPDNGNGFFRLRYLCRDQEVVEAFRTCRDPDIIFNYWGRFDANDVSESWNSVKATGSNYAGDNQAPYTMGIDAWIWEKRLHVEFTYTPRHFRQETMERLGDLFAEELTEIIRHCLNLENKRRSPSDFELLRLTPAQIDLLPRNCEDVYPLSAMQRGMLFYCLSNPSVPAYHVQSFYTIHNEVDLGYLEAAFNKLIEKYAVLRSIFWLEGFDQPVQAVLSGVALKVQYEDLSSLTEEQQNRRTEEFHENDIRSPFDLSAWPLVRLRLFKKAPSLYQLSWIFHHLILDGWSYAILMQEWLSNYTALQCGKSIPAPTPGNYFKDFIRYQLEQSKDEKAKDFWKNELAGAVHNQLPLDRPRGQNRTYRAANSRWTLTLELSERLRDASRRSHSTLSEIFLAAYVYLLHVLCGDEEVTVGLVTSGRSPSLSGSEQTVGVLLNTIPIRTLITKLRTFQELLQQIHENLSRGMEFEHLPLPEILRQERGLRQESNLFDTIFVFEKYPTGREDSGTFQIRGTYGFEMTNYDLTLQVLDGSEITFNFSYASDLFEKESVEIWARRYRKLLDIAAIDLERPLHRIELLTEEEKKVLAEVNQTHAEYPENELIHELFEAQVERTPDNVAVRFEGRELTYGELNKKANRLASVLREKGTTADSIIALMVNRSLELVIGVLGILKSGAAYLPIDPTYPRSRLEYMLKDSGAKLLLTKRSLAGGIEFGGEILDLEDPCRCTGDGANLRRISRPESLAYVIYTSGSTGNPKGVLTQQNGLVNYIHWRINKYEYTPNDITLQMFSFSFDGFGANLYASLLTGGKLIIPSDDKMKDFDAIREVIRREKVTNMCLIPSTYQAILEVSDEDSLRSLRFVAFGGEKATKNTLRLSKTMNPDTVLSTEYGPTENSVVTTSFTWRESENPQMIGRPLNNNQVYILDKNGSLSPLGVAGEICVWSVGLARGYLNRPELTDEKFVPNPFIPGERMYKTGDLGRWLPDGNIELWGRMDHQVKIRGFRIELGEIENQLINHDSIREAVVMARDDSAGNKYLCAYLVTEKDLTVAELREYLSRALPEYMIPSHFVRMARMPLNPNGKIDRAALPEPDESIASGAEYQAPRSEVERTLAAIWQEVLGVNQIGIDHNFFELGGDSIKSIAIASRLRKYDWQLDASDLFRHPTIRVISNHVRSIGQQIGAGLIDGEVKPPPIQNATPSDLGDKELTLEELKSIAAAVSNL